MKRVLLPFLSLALVLSACGDENEVAVKRGAVTQDRKIQVMVITVKAELDPKSGQMALMQTFDYTGMEMQKNDTTVAGDKYGTDTCHIDSYGNTGHGRTVVIRPVRPIQACKEQPLPSEHRINNAVLGGTMKEPPCDCLVNFDGPKGIDVIYYDEKGQVLTMVNSVTWGMVPSDYGKVTVRLNQTKKDIDWNTYTKKNCPPKERCDGVCVDFGTDPKNCGACGNHCKDNKICQDGKCVCPLGWQWCETVFGAGCVDLNTDKYNCGKCDFWCDIKAGKACQGGICKCLPGWKWCATPIGKFCVDVSVSYENCGACGKVCNYKPGMQCVNGQCEEQSCPEEEKCGGILCKDLDTDDWHCGKCDNKCLYGQDCQAGKCVCDPGKTDCGPVVGCRDLTSDLANCGKCGNKCDYGTSCYAGKCECKPWLTDCGASGCRDLEDDPGHCGNCDYMCNKAQYCWLGKCKYLTLPK